MQHVYAKEWDVRAPENSLGYVIHCVIRLQPHHARTYRKKLRNKWTTSELSASRVRRDETDLSKFAEN